jgi:hypothetical protein
VAVAALIVLIVVLPRKRPLRKKPSGTYGAPSPEQQKEKPHIPAPVAGSRSIPPPSYGGAGSGSGDAGWMGTDVPDEAAMMRTPDVTQEQMPVAVKVRTPGLCDGGV